MNHPTKVKVVIIGGGLSAAHLAIACVKRKHDVHLIMRSYPLVSQFEYMDVKITKLEIC